jgi:hypothetical protein
MVYTNLMFDHGCPHEELVAFLKDRFIPYLHRRQIRILEAQQGLSPSEYQLAFEDTGKEDMASLLSNDDEGRELYQQFLSKTNNACQRRLLDLEPDVAWFREDCRLYHLETFNIIVDTGAFEKFMVEEAFPYWRGRGFHTKLFRVMEQPGKYLLMTEMSMLGSIDRWSEMALGEERGMALMQRMAGSMDYPRGSVLKDITGKLD